MDKNFYYQKRAEEHQREIARELENHTLLKNADTHLVMSAKQVRRLVLRLAPVAIAMALLLLFSLLG